jgi:hypothetical protein
MYLFLISLLLVCSCVHFIAVYALRTLQLSLALEFTGQIYKKLI